MKHHGKSERHHDMSKMKGFHGSPLESHETHGGKEGVPRELMVGAGPGMQEGGRKSEMAKSQFEGGSKTSGKVKGMKTYNQE